jgi:hypothetical protein
MSEHWFLDDWGHALLWTGIGAGLMFLFYLMGWNPGYFAIGWLALCAGWFAGRLTPRGRNP